MQKEKISLTVPPSTSARQAYSTPLGRSIDSKNVQARILTVCSSTCEIAFLYTRRTAVKYPESAEHKDSGSRERESARMLTPARGSCKR